ncbi:MAG: ABC transporter C-terminal domain-containing protein, partial [Deltaproteobacteria bacterium]
GSKPALAVNSSTSLTTPNSPVPPLVPLPPLNKEVRLKDREEEKRRKREEQSRQKQMGDVESQIAAIEKELASLEGEMNAPGFFDDPERGQRGGERHAELNVRLEQLYGEWEGLSG